MVKAKKIRRPGNAAYARARAIVIQARKIQAEEVSLAHLTSLNRLPSFVGMNQVNTLDISGTKVSDLSPIAALSLSLNHLHLNNTPVSDISVVSGLRNLQSLYINGTQVSDLAPLRSHKTLVVLQANGTPLSDLSPIADRGYLILYFNNTRVSDLSPLAQQSDLYELHLRKTNVSDLAPISELASLVALDVSETKVSNLMPLANLIELARYAIREPVGGGLFFANCPLSDAFLTSLANRANPERTVQAIGHLRQQQGLPSIDPYKANTERFGDSHWREVASRLEQAPFGAQFVRRDEFLAIDPSGNSSDIAASADTVVGQLHEALKKRAKDFSEIARRVDNQPGWTGLGDVADRFSKTIDCQISDIPLRIGTVYESAIALGSFVELDAQLRKSPRFSAADPLDLDVRRVLVDLVRTAAPWVRSFPSARALDDEAGAFLTRKDLYEPAEQVVKTAEAARVISREDARVLRMVIEAANRGEFQGQKAGARGIWSSRNLITALAVVLSFEMGLVNNKAAEQSVIARKGAEFYLRAEREVLYLFGDAPEDIQRALMAMIDDLRRWGDRIPANLPETPRQKFIRPEEPKEDNDEEQRNQR